MSNENAPTYYNYNSDTFEYTGTVRPQPNPVREGQWLMPAHATDIKPPEAKSGYAIVFDETSKTWSYVEDHRGEIWYNKQGYQIKITKLGDPAKDGYLKDNPIKPTPTPPQVLAADKFWNMMLSEFSVTKELINNKLGISGDVFYIQDENIRSYIINENNYINSMSYDNYFFHYFADIAGFDNDKKSSVWKNMIEKKNLLGSSYENGKLIWDAISYQNNSSADKSS